MATVSMKDVALAAGVSQPAVSYAYNRPSKLSEAQRKHILEVAERLGYAGPNIMGRSLRSGRIGAIGLMMMDKLSLAFADPFTISLLRGISEIGELENVALTLFPLNNKRVALRSDVPGNSSLAVRGLVDGLIVSTLPDNHPAVPSIVQQKIPFVIVDSPLIEEGHYVGIDDRGAARLQIRHLLELGHRKIGILVDRLNPDSFRGFIDAQRLATSEERIMRERLTGYVEEAQQFGVAFADLKIYEVGALDSVSGQAAAFTLLTSCDITAVVGSSDVMAVACMKTARELNRAIPEALSVVGFDDIPEAAQMGLTTITQPIAEKGMCAARFLLEALNAPPGARVEPKRRIFPTELVIRTSTQAIG
jgi:DNA-binding LacI/PurR family transcriptional regulator